MKTVFLLASLSSVLVLPAIAAAQQPTALAEQAESILRTHCYKCHGQDGSLEGGFSYVLDRQRMIDLETIVAGSPDTSYLFARIDSGEMPPAEDNLGNKLARITDAEKETLRKWLAAGAPDFNEAAAERVAIDPADVLDLMAADLRKLRERDRQFTRYFTLTHLYNAGLSEDELQSYRIGLSKLVNSLSWGRRVVQPKPIDPAKTILRIDLRDYRWTEDGDKWDLIVSNNPYGIVYDTESASFCIEATKSPMPLVRADWFVAKASQPPLYHDVLGIPQTAGELEDDRLNVAAAENIRIQRVARAGFNRSGVSQNNRLIERHESPHGAYWKSYDFAGNVGRQNLFENPLGPDETGATGFLHDGGELIFNLPNGLQGYMLVDAAEQRIDKGPTNIVSDPLQPDRAVVNGLSCMSCHVRGMIYKADEIRGHVEATPDAFSGEEAQMILALYPPTEEFRTLVEEDAARFAAAVGQSGVKLDDDGQIIGSDPITTLARLFERELDLSAVAAEAGLSNEEFLRGLDGSPRLARVFGSLRRPSGTVKRDAYVASFGAIVEDLNLGDLLEPTSGAASPPKSTETAGDTTTPIPSEDAATAEAAAAQADLFAQSEYIRTTLDQLGLKYEVIESSGNYKLTFDMEGGRTQMVIVNTETRDFRGLRVRDVWAPAFQVQGTLSGDMANRLLLDSEDRPLGAWETVADNGNDLVMFTTKIDANAAPQLLHQAILTAIFAADAMDKEVNAGGDQY